MQGRIEAKQKVESSIKEKIGHYPSWVSDYFYSLANNTHNTKQTYVKKICLFLDHYLEGKSKTNAAIKRVSSVDVNRYIDHLKNTFTEGREISKETIALTITALNSFFSFLTLQGYIKNNPMDKAVRRPSINYEKDIIYLENDEIKILLDNVENGVGSHRSKAYQNRWRNRDRLLILLPLVTGMRVSALDEINVEDIDFEKKEVRVIEKREKQRSFLLDDEMIRLVQLWLDDRESMLNGIEQPALFIGGNKGEYGRLTVRSIERIVKKYCEGIDKHISPHKLRSTFGTQFYRQTGDIYLTAEMMGHNSTKVTSRYVVIDKTRKEAESKRFATNILKQIDM